MSIKSFFFVLVLFSAGKLLHTDGSTILYQPYLLRTAVPVLPVANPKLIYITDKPDEKVGNKLIKLGNDVKPFLPWGRSLTAKMIAVSDWLEYLQPGLITAGLNLKEGRLNPEQRSSLSLELRKLGEVSNHIADEMKTIVADSRNVIDLILSISNELNE